MVGTDVVADSRPSPPLPTRRPPACSPSHSNSSTASHPSSSPTAPSQASLTHNTSCETPQVVRPPSLLPPLLFGDASN